MAVSDLQTALTNLDAQIAAATAARGDQISADGLTVKRKSLKDLLEQRKLLVEAIASDGSSAFELHSVGLT